MSYFLLQPPIGSSDLAKNLAELLASSHQLGRKEYLLQFIKYLQSAMKARIRNGEPTDNGFVTRRSRNTFMEQNYPATSQMIKLLVVIAAVGSVGYRALV